MTVRVMAFFIWSSCRCLLAQAIEAQNEQQQHNVSEVSLKLQHAETIFLCSSCFVFRKSNLFLGEHAQSHSYYVGITSCNATDSQEAANPKTKDKMHRQTKLSPDGEPLHVKLVFINTVCGL